MWNCSNSYWKKLIWLSWQEMLPILQFNANALHSGRFSTAWLWIGPSLDRRTPKSKVTAFLWCNSLSRHFANSGPKDFAKFQNFDPCTVCGKTLRDSGGVYLPAFWATSLYYSITCFLEVQSLVLYNCYKGVWPKKQVIRGCGPKSR